MTQLEKVKVKSDGAQTEEIKTCSHYDYDKCMYNAITTIMRNDTMDNCTTPFVLDTHKICTRSEDIKVSYLVGLRRMENQGGDCAIPCRSLFITVGNRSLKKYKNRKYGEFFAYYRSRVYIVKEYYLYTILNFIAEVGKKLHILLSRELIDVALLHNHHDSQCFK